MLDGSVLGGGSMTVLGGGISFTSGNVGGGGGSDAMCSAGIVPKTC